MKTASLLRACLLALLPLTAAATAPADAAPLSDSNPVEATLIDGWQRADGSRIAALRVRLAPGWKTYWRAPGDSGIPPRFDWSASQNLKGVEIIWPAPKVIREDGVRTIGYARELVLPFAITPDRKGKPVTLQAALEIGVCRDVCMPKHLQIKATLDSTSSTPVPAIAAAIAGRAWRGEEAGLRHARCTLRPGPKGLEIEARLALPHTGGQEVVVIEPGPGLWASPTDSRRAGGELIVSGDLTAADGGRPVGVDRSKLVISVLGRDKVVEIDGCTPG